MEDWNKVKARRPRPWWQVPVEIACVLALGLAAKFFLLPYYHAHTERIDQAAPPGDPEAMELAHLKMLAHALKLHADEHGGAFPPAVSEIEWRQNLPAMKWAGLPAAVSRFHNPESGTRADWLYYPGHTENDPPDTILVAAPVALGKDKDRRMVARVNDVAETIAEADFQRQTTATPAPPATATVTP